MARPHRTKIPRQTRLAVYVRDEWTCQDCGRRFQPTEDGSAPYFAPDGTGYGDFTCLELDHITPVKLGGGDDAGNLRALCSPCNRKKLATTRLLMWPNRIALAKEVLSSGEPNEQTAIRAAALLLGYRQNEMPSPKPRCEAGF